MLTTHDCDAVLITSLDEGGEPTQVLSANDAAAALFRCSAQELRGRPVPALLRATRGHALAAQKAAEPCIVPCELLALCAAESLQVIDVEVSRLEEGAPLSALLVLRAQAAEALPLSTSSALTWEFWTTPRGSVVCMSDASRHITGYRAEEFLADATLFDQIVYPDDRQAVQDFRRQGTLPGPFAELEFRIRRRDGTIRWLAQSLQPVLTDTGRLLGVHAINRDVTETRTIREALKESEFRYRTLIENLQQGVVLVDRDDAVTYANPAMLVLLGCTRDHLVQHRVGGFVHPADAKRYEQLLTRRSAAVCEKHEFRLVRAHGDVIDVSMNTSPLAHAEDDCGALLVFTDITESKVAERELRRSRDILQRRVRERTEDLLKAFRDLGGEVKGRIEAEEALRQSQAHLSAVLAHAPISLWTADREGVVQLAAGAIASGSGRSEEYVGRSVFELFEQTQDLRNAFDAASTGARGEIYTTTEGRILHHRLFPMTAPDRTVVGVTGVTMDVTTQRRAERSLLTALSRLQELESIVNRSPAVVVLWRVTEGWPVEFVSDNVSQFGYSQEELLRGRVTWEGITHPADAARVQAEILGFFESDTIEFTQQYRLIAKSGAARWIEDRSKTLKDADGTITHVQSIVLDITERKLAEDRYRDAHATLRRRSAQLRALASELTQAEQRERRRLAQVLHDSLQQLLVGAKFSIDSARRQVKEPGLSQSLQQVKSLLDESIAVSRSLTAELSPAILYDAGLAAGLDWLARQMQEKHGLFVAVSAEEEAEPDDEGIRVLLFQCVRELLFNIVKHAGTTSARLDMTREDGRICLRVSDEGVGFDPEEAHESDSGFGLFSIRERLTLLGGEIEIDSGRGRGTRVTLSAPLEPNRIKPGAPAPKGEDRETELSQMVPPEEQRFSDGKQRVRLILADDHNIVRQGLISLLQAEPDIDVIGEASNGQGAIEMARKLRPNVVIMDVNMPDVNGIEATRCIRKELPDVHVIALSMHTADDMAAAMRAAGADAYLNKGGPCEALLEAIRVAAGQPARNGGGA